MCLVLLEALHHHSLVSARSITVKNVLMPTLVGNKLFISQYSTH